MPRLPHNPQRLQRASEMLMIVGLLAFVLGGEMLPVVLPAGLGIVLFAAGKIIGRNE